MFSSMASNKFVIHLHPCSSGNCRLATKKAASKDAAFFVACKPKLLGRCSGLGSVICFFLGFFSLLLGLIGLLLGPFCFPVGLFLFPGLFRGFFRRSSSRGGRSSRCRGRLSGHHNASEGNSNESGNKGRQNFFHVESS